MLQRKEAGRLQTSEEIESVFEAYTKSPRKGIVRASMQCRYQAFLFIKFCIKVCYFIILLYAYKMHLIQDLKPEDNPQ